MSELIPAAVVVLGASVLQACTGFGFSVLATPFLLLVYDGREAIQINIILSTIISLWLVPRLMSSVDRPLLRRLIMGSFAGSFAGIALYVYANASTLKVVIGVLLLVFTVLILVTPGFRTNARRDRIVGGISGALTSGLGMPGPPLLVYLAGAKMEKAALRSTSLAYFLFIYALSLLLQTVSASSTFKIWTHAAALIPMTLFGVYVGNWLFYKINHKLFMKIIYLILAATGIYLIWVSI